MRALAVILLFAANAAWADVPTLPPAAPGMPPPPASVWRPLEGGAVENLQSGLACPSSVDAFQRTRIELFDGFGFDVGCNYSSDAAVITVYLTRRGSGDLAAAMDEAKREFLQGRASQHPKPVSEVHLTLNGVAWDKALYVDDGDQGDEIWIADLDGWTYEHRVTYPAAEAAVTQSVLAKIMRASEASAGSKLSSCAKSAPAQRTGARIVDAKVVSDAAMMTSLMGSAAIAAANEHPETAKSSMPTIWCVEQAAKRDGRGYLFWRGVFADGADAGSDQVSLLTIQSPPIMDISADEMANLVRKSAHTDAAPTWVATTNHGGKIAIYGYFQGRPGADAAIDLFNDVLEGKAKPIGGYSVDGKTINISVSPK